MKLLIHVTIQAIGFIAVFLMASAHAHNNVVVVPLGEDAKPLGNVITVAKKNGDFTSPIAAINSIPSSGAGAPSASNQYLIVIGPGEYSLPESLKMREWVSIAGSGVKATTLTGAISSGILFSSGIIEGANNAELSHLKIINTGGSSFSIGVSNSGGGPTMSHLEIAVSGGSSANVGILNSSASFASISYITSSASGGTNSAGIVFENGASQNTSYVTATASGGTFNYGVHIFSGSPNMSHVTATGSGSPNSYGLYTSTALPSPRITNSLLTGGTADIRISNVNTRFINTQLTNGSVENNLPSAQCFGVYDANLNAVDC